MNEYGKKTSAKYNFKPFGTAIKAARKGRKESRNKVGDEMYISPRYLANIENKGQHPGRQIFFELVSRYHVSVDQFLFEDTMEGKSTVRRQLDTLLDGLDEKEIGIVTAILNLRYCFTAKWSGSRSSNSEKNTLPCCFCRYFSRKVVKLFIAKVEKVTLMIMPLWNHSTEH